MVARKTPVKKAAANGKPAAEMKVVDTVIITNNIIQIYFALKLLLNKNVTNLCIENVY